MRTVRVFLRERDGLGPLSAEPGRPGITVADELPLPGQAAWCCPAGVMVAGELASLGVPASCGPIVAREPSPGARPRPGARYPEIVLGAELGDGVGLALAVTEGLRPLANRVLDGWLAVAGPRTVLLPFPRSFCAGVERAIDTVLETLEQRDGPVYVRKQIVHNTHVVADLEARGVVFITELDQVPDGATVVFSAHGVPPAVRQEASRRGLDVVDATCPMVAKVHAEARRIAGRGDTVILIGHADHDEVTGVVGEAPEAITVVEDSADIAALDVPDPARVSYLTQTTLAVDETTAVVDALRRRYPRLRNPGLPDRQRGGHQARWLAGVRTVGLTAGASAPPGLVTGVVHALEGLGPVLVEEKGSEYETIQFTLPSNVKAR